MLNRWLVLCGLLACAAIGAHAGTMRVFQERGVLMVPLRYIAERLGASVDAVNGGKGGVKVSLGGKNVVLKAGNKSLTMDGKEYTTTAPPVALDAVTYVPVALVAQGLGAKVDWNAPRQAMVVSYAPTKIELLLPGWDRRDYTFDDIHLDAFGGQVDRLRKDLADGAGVDDKDSEGRTAMHWAATGDQVEAARYLLDHGASMEIGDTQFGNRPLHEAVLLANERVVRLMLDRGAAANAKTKAEETPLTLAALKGYTGQVQILLDAHADPMLANAAGGTALHAAARGGQAEIIRILVHGGAKLESQATNNKFTPLQEAVLAGKPAAVKMLLDLGANVNAVGNQGVMAVHLAAVRGYSDILEILLARGASTDARADQETTPLHYAAQFGERDAVVKLIAHKADVAAKTTNGATPLHLAAASGDRPTLVALLNAAADPNAVDTGGETPLHVAVRAGQPDAVDALLWRGAKVDTPDKNGNTPLITGVGYAAAISHMLGKPEEIRARYDGVKASLKQLLARKADVNTVPAAGSPALHAVARSGRSGDAINTIEKELIWLLLDHKADINLPDKAIGGTTPLGAAARAQRPQLVGFLLDSNARLEAINGATGQYSGQRALHIACQAGDLATVRLLLARGADIRATVTFTNDRGDQGSTTRVADTALTAAIRAQGIEAATRKELVTLLLDHKADINAALITTEVAPVPILGPFKVEAPVPVGVAPATSVPRFAPRDSEAPQTIQQATFTTTDTPLTVAIAAGDTEIVKLLLARKANANVELAEGRTSMHVAAKLATPEIIARLLAAGVALDTVSAVKMTPLLEALDAAKLENAQALLRAGASPAAVGKNGDTALHLAAQTSLDAMVDAMLAQGLKPDTRNVAGATSLLLATRADKPAIVEMLLAKGAGVDLADNNGQTPLYAAASTGRTALVKALLARGAKPDLAVRASGATPLHMAAGLNNALLVEAIAAQRKDLKPGEKALLTPAADTVAALLGAKADVNARLTANKRTPLHEALTPSLQAAARPGDPARDARLVVAALLAAPGIDINAADALGITPLHMAAQQGDLVIANLLIAKGANLDTPDNMRKTPLDYAIERGKQPMVELLLSKGAKE